MLFNSIEFALFLPIVFILYWFVFSFKLRLQNALIVVASYFFYGIWDWRFLSLIIFSTLLDFFIGQSLDRAQKSFKRKLLLALSLLGNLGLLGFFKYHNFFIENLIATFTLFGKNLNVSTLEIILPVGISFYTFQTLSYTIDIYRRKFTPTKDIIAFAAFVSFFPQLVAGPIERATNLLPQFFSTRKFELASASNGLRQILWGLFKKMVIADNCAEFVNLIFSNHQDYSGSTLLFGAIFFAFQIYGDFSGYSDIAIGTARLFGFNLMQNFAFPYFSRDIAEFWRRWHISLSTWFRDYLYIPLGGSRGSQINKIKNTLIIFIVSGLWHGPNWTFVIWGGLNAIYFLPLLLRGRNRSNIEIVAKNRFFPSLSEFAMILVTFFITTIAWIFFRSPDLWSAVSYLRSMFSTTLFSFPDNLPLKTSILVAAFIVAEWLGREHSFALDKIKLATRTTRYAVYYSLILLIFLFASGQKQFIYFQF